jgi:hypothetical protein
MPDFGFEHWPSGIEATAPGTPAYVSEAEGSIPSPGRPSEEVQQGLAQQLGVNTLSLDEAMGTGSEPYESGETPPHIPAQPIPEAADAPPVVEGGTDHQMPTNEVREEHRDAAGQETTEAESSDASSGNPRHH